MSACDYKKILFNIEIILPLVPVSSSSASKEKKKGGGKGDTKVPAKPKAKCYFFSKTGNCRYGDKCMYDHSTAKVNATSEMSQDERGTSSSSGAVHATYQPEGG